MPALVHKYGRQSELRLLFFYENHYHQINHLLSSINVVKQNGNY